MRYRPATAIVHRTLIDGTSRGAKLRSMLSQR
jgi:hypothetical protein